MHENCGGNKKTMIIPIQIVVKSQLKGEGISWLETETIDKGSYMLKNL